MSSFTFSMDMLCSQACINEARTLRKQNAVWKYQKMMPLKMVFSGKKFFFLTWPSMLACLLACLLANCILLFPPFPLHHALSAPTADLNGCKLILLIWHLARSSHLWPTTATGQYRYILVIKDCFSTFCWLIPTKTKSAANKISIIHN